MRRERGLVVICASLVVVLEHRLEETKHCTDDVYAHLDSTATQVQAIITDALNAAGVPNSPQRAGNLFSWFFTNETVHTYDEAKTQNDPSSATASTADSERKGEQ